MRFCTECKHCEEKELELSSQIIRRCHRFADPVDGEPEYCEVIRKFWRKQWARHQAKPTDFPAVDAHCPSFEERDETSVDATDQEDTETEC